MAESVASATGSAATSERVRIGAVVLNFRTPAMTGDCVASLITELDPARDRIVLVDNASGDDSAEQLAALAAEHAPLVEFVEADENRGFAAGNNLGIRRVDARYYLLLNSDTIVRPGAIDLLLRALEAAPRTGLVSPRLEWPDGEPQISCFRLLSPTSEFLAAARTGPLARWFASAGVALPLPEEPIEPQWTSFAAVLVRAEALNDISLLDEGFFLYYEDVDACRRLLDAGWHLRHEPTARVVHLRGGSGPVKEATRERRRRPAYYYASRRRYFRMAYGAFGPLRANLAWSAGRLVSRLRELVGNKEPHTVEREELDNWMIG